MGIFGLPGTGKSTLVRKLMETITSVAICKTHAAASVLNGKTIDYFVGRYIRNGSFGGNALFIDEISQVECSLIADLYKLVYMKVQTIIIGDFHQLPPVTPHTWKGQVQDEDVVEKSLALWRMCGGQYVELKENMRSDQVLFDYYSKLISEPMDLEDAKRSFPKKEGHPRWSLVVPHRLRIKINGVQNKFEKPKDAVFIKKVKSSGPNKPQNMWIYPGQVLRSSVTKKPIQNGCFYTIKAIGEEVQF